jgi:hypothetical protein
LPGSGPEECTGSAGQDDDTQPQQTQVREIDENINVEDGVKTEHEDESESSQDKESICEISGSSSYEINEGRLGTLSPENLSYEKDTKVTSPQNFLFDEHAEANSPKNFLYENHTEANSTPKEIEINRNTYRLQPSAVTRMFYPSHFDIFSSTKSSAQQSVGRNEGQTCVENSQNECSCCCKQYSS